MKRKKMNRNAGLTLIEMMISTALLAIFSIFLVNLVMVTQKAFTIELTATPVRTEAKKAVEVMVREFREGDPDAYGGVDITGTAPSQSITFGVPEEVSESGILSYRSVVFAHDAAEKSITRTTNGSTTVVARNIDSLLFSYSAANKIVTATVATSKLSPDGITLQTTLEAQIHLRN